MKMATLLWFWEHRRFTDTVETLGTGTLLVKVGINMPDPVSEKKADLGAVTQLSSRFQQAKAGSTASVTLGP